MAYSHRAGAASLPAHRIFVGTAAMLAAVTLQPTGARASQITACTRLDICYCVNTDYRDAISDNVARVRALIASNKTARPETSASSPAT
jgi:hypothetical protein